jgi:cysteine-rich repeat protein
MPTSVDGVYAASVTVADAGASYAVGKAVSSGGESALSNEIALAALPSSCGNGQLDAGEACDDGGQLAGDGCRADCTIELCGDRIVDAPSEQCDDGNTTLGDGCELCLVKRIPACGDGFLDAGEACDDGNTLAGDGCRATCTIERCGDRIVDAPAEQCDDGNTVAGDGCESCRTARIPRCGDGFLDAGESCDDGNTVAGDGCRATCTVEVCGDRIVDAPAEQCDDGNSALGDGCESCRTARVASCGDGVLDAGEACDDGNTSGGDGCDAQCLAEVAGTLPYRVDVGGNSFEDSRDQLWGSDEPFTSDGVVARSTLSVAGTVDDPLYWTRRLGSVDGSGLHFELPVPGMGPYKVRLHFAELDRTVRRPGDRVFDVQFEGGALRIEDFDVVAAAGGIRRAVVREQYVLVGDGSLSIELIPVRGQPFVSAIEVVEGGAPPAAPAIRR